MAVDIAADDGGNHPVRPDGPTVTMCRGCCCGSSTKHPLIDHAAQEGVLSDELPPTSRLRVSDCLGPCERADVVVVHPRPDARRAGARPVWLAGVGPAAAREVTRWAAAGGPGIEPTPVPLDDHVMPAPGRSS